MFYFLLAKLFLPCILLCCLFLLCFVACGSEIQTNVVASSSETKVGFSANQTAVVDIATPNSYGLSYNQYQNFDVGSSGLILNNFAGNSADVVQTQLAGFVNVNNNLQPNNEAKIIVNEVISPNPSRLAGYLEVAGKKAEVIIANPYGINFSSAGFINTNKMTAVVGSLVNNGGFDGENWKFNLSQQQNGQNFLPSLVIEKNGIDLESVDISNFVANQIVVNGNIYAGENEVWLQTGNNLYEKQSQQANSADGQQNQEQQIAIDVANFAQIQAGNIYLIATQSNAQINQLGSLLAEKEVALYADRVVNNNIVADAGNIQITAKNLQQFGFLYAKNQSINVALQNLDNQGSIIAKTQANLDVDNVLNNADLAQIFAKDLVLNAANLENFGNISASQNLYSKAIKINNRNNILAEQNMFLQVDDFANFGNVVAKNNLDIVAKNLLNQQNITAKNGSLLANKLDNQQNIVSAENLKIVADNIKNNNLLSAKQLAIATQNIVNSANLQAIDLLDINFDSTFSAQLHGDISSAGSIIIKSQNGLINNAKIFANNNINLVANGNLLNNGSIVGDNLAIEIAGNFINNQEISLNNNLTIKANSVENQQKILVTSANLTAKNLVNYANLLVANNLTVNGDSFVNQQVLEVGKDANFWLSNSFVNKPNSLFYAGGNINLFVANLLQNQDNAIIYANGNLVIQKDVNKKNLSLLENVFATLEAGQNISVYADRVNNRGIDYDADPNGFYGYNVLYQVPQNARGNGFMALMFQDIAVGTLRTKWAKITAGANLSINNATINNFGSSISAKNNIVFNNSSFNNQTSSVMANNLKSTYGKYWYTKSCKMGRWNCKTYYNQADQTAFSSVLVLSKDVANLKAGNNIVINNAGYVNNGYLNNSVGLKPVLSSANNGKIAINNNSSQLDLSLFAESPFFIKHINNNRPLLETRLQFIDKEQFVISDYFYQKLGITRPVAVLENNLPKDDVLSIIGDGFAQNQLIIAQLQDLLPNTENQQYTNDNYQQIIATLVDNAKIEAEKLNLQPNQPLNNQQISNLTRDILWFEPKMVQQQKYLTPVIYLANYQETDSANSLIFAGNNIEIQTQQDLLNFGNITANNISMVSANNIENKPLAKIMAKQDAVLLASNNIINSAFIFANNNLTVKAKNIVNASIVNTNQQNLLQNQFYVNQATEKLETFSSIVDVATMLGKNINLEAENNITNLSANISADQNLLMQGNNIEIGTLNLVNSQTYKTGSGNNYMQKTITESRNVASNISTSENMQIVANNDFMLLGSNIEAKKDLNISAENTINISAVADYTNINISGKQYSEWLKKRFFSNHDIIVNKSANLSANNISLSSGDNSYVVASNVNAVNDLQISAGNGNNSADLYLLNGIDIDSLYTQNTQIKYGFSLKNSATTAVATSAVVGTTATGGLGSPIALSAVVLASLLGSVNKQKSISTSLNYQEKAIASNLNFGNNLSLFASNKISISSSNLNFSASKPENFANVMIVAKNLNIVDVKQTNINAITLQEHDNYWQKNGSYGEINQQIAEGNINISNLQQAKLNVNNIENIFANHNDFYDFLTKNHTTKIDNEKTVINSTNRSLTDAGAMLVAITSAAVTANVFSSFVAPSATATSSAVTTTSYAGMLSNYFAIESAKQGAIIASASAFNSGASVSLINNEGNFDNTWQDINSKQFVQNLAIATISGGLSAGFSAKLLSQNLAIQNTQNIENVFTKAAINTASTSLSFALVEQKNPLNILKQVSKQEAVFALANLGATEIGNLAHPHNRVNQAPINSDMQLALHGALGCSAMVALNASCLGGVASGVLGEVVAENAYKNGISSQGAVDLSGLASVVAINNVDNKNLILVDRIAKNSASNNAVKVWLHNVAFGNYHLSIKLEPENQAKYANDARFQNIDSDNKRFATIGAGPDNLDILKIPSDWLGNLNAGETVLGVLDGINRARDIDITNKVWESENLVPKELDDFYINKLFALNAGYNNKVGYELFPDKRDENYNSNSYVTGLLIKANLKTNILPMEPVIITAEELQDYGDNFPLKPRFYFMISKYNTPGYKKPLTSNYFNPLYLNSSIDNNIINEKYVSHL